MPMKVKILNGIIRAMTFIHHNGIVHRDLKSHNILIDESFNVKICDFGLAKYKSELNSGNSKFSGTPSYMAAELFNKKAYDEKVDIFAFGTLMWEILNRKIPFDGFEISSIKSLVSSGEELPMPKSIPSGFTVAIKDCRALNPLQRPTFKDLLKILFN